MGSWGHSQQQGVGVPGAQVRQEQGADVGVLRYGHGATASGTREVPQSGHKNEEQSSLFGRDDFDDYLLLTPADRLTRKPKKTCPGAPLWRLCCIYVTQKINLSII